MYVWLRGMGRYAAAFKKVCAHADALMKAEATVEATATAER